MTLFDLIEHDDTAPDAIPEEVTQPSGGETPPEAGPNSTDSSANDGAVAGNRTGPAPLIEVEMGDRADGPPQTDISGQPDAVERNEFAFQLFSTVAELFAATDWGDVLRLANFKLDDIRLTAGQRAAGDCSCITSSTSGSDRRGQALGYAPSCCANPGRR